MEESATSEFLMVEIQKLEAKDYDVLKNVADGICPNPEASIAIVAVDKGEIVGRMFLLAPAHIEGTWIKQDHRNGFTGLRMFQSIVSEAKQAGLTKILSFSDASTDDYLKRLGFSQMPYTVWEKEL